MAPLTWQNVTAPSFTGVNDALRLAGQSFNMGFDALDRSLGNFQEGMGKAQSNKLMLDLMKYQDPASARAALMNGTVFQGVDPRNLSADAIDFAARLPATQLANEASGQINRARDFDYTRANINAGRSDAQFAATPASNEMMVRIRTLAQSGDPAQLAEARKLAAENSQLFSSAGIDIDGQLSFLGGNTSSFEGGMSTNKTIAENADYWDNRVAKDDSDAIVEFLRNSTGSAQEALTIAQNDPRISPQVLRKVVEDISSNAGTYYASTPDAIDQLLNEASGGTANGAPPGLINNESGGSLAAKNDAVGSSGRKGHFGAAQFSQDRLDEARSAGAIPAGMTNDQFLNSPEAQESAEKWHWNDIQTRAASDTDISSRIGETIKGVVITPDSIKAMAHIGGFNGMKKFITSNGEYDPADDNGSTISQYGRDFGGSGNSSFSGAPSSSSFGSAPINPDRRQVQNPDGTISTERSITIKDGNNWVNIPTLVNGVQLSEAEAEAAYKAGGNDATGRFKTVKEAEEAAQARSDEVGSMLASAAADTPATASQATSGGSTLANTQVVDSLFNQNQSLDLAVAQRPYFGKSRASVVKMLKEGDLSAIEESTLTSTVKDIMETYNVPADVAGHLMEDNVQGIKKTFFGTKPTLQQWLGTPDISIDMEGVKNDVEAYRNGNNISEGVARQNTQQQSAGLNPQLQTLVAAAERSEKKWEQAQRDFAAGKNIDINSAALIYQQEQALIQSKMAEISESGVPTAYSNSITSK